MLVVAGVEHWECFGILSLTRGAQRLKWMCGARVMIIFDRSIRSIEHSEGEDGPCNEASLFCRCLAFVPLVAPLLYT